MLLRSLTKTSRYDSTLFHGQFYENNIFTSEINFHIYTFHFAYHKIVGHKLHNFKFHISITISFKYHGGEGFGVFKGGGKAGVAPPKIRIIPIGRACAIKDFELYSTVEANNKNRCRGGRTSRPQSIMGLSA